MVETTRRFMMHDIGLDPHWTHTEYSRGSGSMMNAGRFSAMTMDGENVVMYDEKKFQRDTALVAWNGL